MLNPGSLLAHRPLILYRPSDLSAIILAIISFLSGLGWMLDRKKHRQEVESLKADNRMKDMELGKAYVDEFRSNIARPLQEEVKDWLSPSSFAPRQIERARLRSVWRRFAYGDSPAEECDTTHWRLPSQC